MNPGNHNQARAQVNRLLSLPRVHKSARRVSAATRVRHVARAEAIAEAIWCHFQVGIWRWRVNHLRWYFDDHLSEFSNETRYLHFLAMRRVIYAIEKKHWLPYLEAYSSRH